MVFYLLFSCAVLIAVSIAAISGLNGPATPISIVGHCLIIVINFITALRLCQPSKDQGT